jgi:outer membrane protein OmpA-like peptidoglycan-associated protein/uncharacterized protein YegL
LEQNSLMKYVLVIWFAFQISFTSGQLAYLHPSANVAVFGNLSINKSYGKHEILKLQVVDVNSGNLLGVINQTIKLGNLVLGLETDAAGQVIAIKTNESTIVWSVTDQKVLQTVALSEVVGFSDGVPTVYLGNCCKVQAIHMVTGAPVQQYDIGSQSGCKKITSTINDDLLAVQTDDEEVLFFHGGNARPVKKLKAASFEYSSASNKIVTLFPQGEAGTCYAYQLPSFERLAKISVATVLREYIKGLNDRARQQGSRNYELLGNVRFNKSYISKDVSTLFVPTIAGRNYYCYVVDIASEKVLFRFEMDDNDFEVEEFGDKLLLLTKKTQYQLWHKTSGWLKAEMKNSPSLAFGYENQTNGVKFFGLGEKAMQQSVTGCEALAADRTNQLALVIDGEKRGKIDLSNSASLKVTWFGLGTITKTEQLVAEGYGSVGNRVSGLKHISEARAEDSLKVVFKTVEGGDRTGVEVVLQDKNGYLYYGASEPEWKHIWCKLAVKQPDGTVANKTQFEVTEYQPSEGIPMAIAIGADFSGSMGKQRAKQLNKGVMTLIQKKRAIDYMSVIKYDHRVIAGPLRTDKNELLADANAINFEQLAGGTALLDAINEGVQQIKFQPNVAQRAIIILTDGKDVSSRMPLSKVIPNAKSNQVKIYTIAYGDEVDTEFLQNIAHRTQGGFYTVASAKDFEWIFEDIYQRASTYYNIGFETTQKGVQIHQLKVCPPNAAPDSLEVEFDNRLDIVTPPAVARNPLKHIGSKPTLKTKAGQQPGVIVTNSEVIKIPKVLADEKTLAEEQFSKIELPQFNFLFDKTEVVKETTSRINTVIAFMNEYPKANLVVIGHTDNYGSDSYNQKLAEKRANEVIALIKQYGGNADRLKAIGYGETSPISPNETEEGRQNNRRVEFRVKW